MAFPWLTTGEGPPNKGKPMPAEQRAKMSVAKKRLAAEGWRPGNTGKKMAYSAEHLAMLRVNIRKAADACRKYVAGDRFPDKRMGYVWVCAPDHPSRNSKGYIHEHRLVAEKALGRRLKRSEVVHHVNGDKSDNMPNNLVICTNEYHKWLHGRMSYIFQRAYFAEEGV